MLSELGKTTIFGYLVSTVSKGLNSGNTFDLFEF